MKSSADTVVRWKDLEPGDLVAFGYNTRVLYTVIGVVFYGESRGCVALHMRRVGNDDRYNPVWTRDGASDEPLSHTDWRAIQ